MPANSLIQQRLLEIIKDVVPDKYSLVNELSEILKISNDSVYRRLRGETLLNIDEIQILCQYFNISFDSITGNDQTGLVSFQYQPIKDKKELINYLSSIKDRLLELQKKENTLIYYAAIDIPLFHNFKFPLVSLFKTFYWLKSISNSPHYQNQKFSSEYLDNDIIEIGRELHNAYITLPSIEIWTDLILNSLLKQVDYYWDSGEFTSKNDALLLCEEIRKEFEYMQACAKNNSKDPEKGIDSGSPINFQAYYSEIEIANNCILTINDNHKITYLSTHTFNVMISSSTLFSNETQRWMESIIAKSTLISGIGEKQRNIIFRNAYDQIEVLKNKINNSN
jgi:hypothetical protein